MTEDERKKPLMPVKLQSNTEVLIDSVSTKYPKTGMESSKKKKKKKLLRKRPSLASASSVDLVRESSGLSENTAKVTENKDSSKTRFPGIVRANTPTTRYTLLATPPLRHVLSQAQVAVPSAHERRKKMPLLAAIKPENEKGEKDRFMRANFNYNPFFIYRYPADADMMQRYGTPSNKYLNQAILIMENAITKYGSYEHFEEQTGGKILTRSQILMLVKRCLKQEDMEDEVCLNLSEDLLSRGSMTRSKGRPVLNVRVVNLREHWAEGLLRHEIGTHYIRSCNNRFQPWYNYKARKELGLKPVNPTEEGLASLHSVIFRKDPCLWRAALLYYTAYKASQMSFKELFRDIGHFVHDPVVRWDYCLRAKRGQVDTSLPGAFCKDQVYLEGALQILKRRRVIDFRLMMRLGKISHEDVDILEEYSDLENTRIPSFMQDMPMYLCHMNRIAECNGLTDETMENVE